MLTSPPACSTALVTTSLVNRVAVATSSDVTAPCQQLLDQRSELRAGVDRPSRAAQRSSCVARVSTVCTRRNVSYPGGAHP